MTIMKSILAFVSILTSFVLTSTTTTYDLSDVVFVILSQPQKYHATIADETKEKLMTNLRKDGVQNPQVFSLHKDLPLHGGWTIFPLLAPLNKISRPETKWFAFLHEAAEVNLDLFKTIVSKYKSDYEIFVGHSLTDLESSVTHHYDPSGELAYPDFKAGFLLSKNLANSLAEKLESNPDSLSGFPSDFSIDATYELAKVISLLHENGPRLDDEPLLCTSEGPRCATFPRPSPSCKKTEESSKELVQQTLFAVKTCQKFHEKRLSVVKDTWGPAAFNLKLVSEVEDPEYGTVVFPGADTNTERGHCQKTEAILNYFYKHAKENNWKWLVIADDDTILSVAKMIDLLECYDDDPEEMIALGQRYGFRVARGTHGYDYQTGGSGMIFNQKMVERMMNLSATHCKCNLPNQPDDMHLGACLTNIGQIMVHSEGLHQGRPADYHPDLLAHQNPISFHKFWMVDPRKIYDQWFRASDEELRQFKFNSLHPHQEL